MQLSDTSLLRSQCYINGEWVGDGGFDVTNPATGEVITSVPRFGADEARQAVEAAKSAMKEWAAKTAKERSAILRRWFDLQMENQEDLAQLMTAEQGKPLVESRGEVAYAASFTEFYRRGGETGLWRDHPVPQGGRAHRRRPPAGRRGGGDHAVELPARHDHPQGVACARRRLHHRLQARERDPAVGLCARRAGRARGRACRRVQRHHRRGPGDRRRTHLQPDRARRDLHRVDRDRQGADGAMRLDREESASGARRQRAVHRVRRCRSRCRGPGRHGVQIPQCRPDLRLRQPDPGAGRGL